MNAENFTNERKMRTVVRQALQLMNRYGLTELEYENKDGEEVVSLRRQETSSSPPLLEGRRAELSGQVRSPAVGQLRWNLSEGDSVDEGDRVAEVLKHNDVVPVTSPLRGIIADCASSDHVEYGDVLFTVVPDSEQNPAEKEEDTS